MNNKRSLFRAEGSPASGPTLGVMLPIFGTLDGNIVPGSIAEAAVYGEQSGLDGLWMGDHLVHPLPLLESIVTLEHIASLTTTVRIGTSVMLLALRSPLTEARQLATIDAYHPGRLTLGIGVGGEHPTEFTASGVPMAERAARLEESVTLIRELWSGEAVQSKGPLEGVKIRPVPKHIPLLFGGHTPKALRRAARLGDGWVGFYKDVNGFAEARSTLRTELEAQNRDTGSFEFGMVLPAIVSDTNEDAARRVGEFMRGASTKNFQSSPDQYVAAGTPERVAERLAEYHAAGCDNFILAVMDQGEAYTEQLKAICEEVLPKTHALGR